MMTEQEIVCPRRTCRLTMAVMIAAAAVISACQDSEVPGNAAAGDAAARTDDPATIYVAAGTDLDEALRSLRGSDGPRIIRLGPGDHRLNAPFPAISNSAIVGAGAGVTRLVAAQQMEHMVGNAGGDAGDRNIALRGLTLDCDGRAQRGAYFVRVSELSVSDVEITRCITDGMRVSGRGEVTRGAVFTDIRAHHNQGDGLIFMWAIRNVQYSNISGHFNGGRGVILDHSEFQASNVSACDNSGDGVHLRNFFAADIRGLYACRNARHGIFVEGMVASTGGGWVAQSNGRVRPGEFDEIHFSARGDLSYGVSRDSTVTGISAGAYRDGFGAPTARYGVLLEPGVSVGISAAVFNETLSGPLCEACEP